MKNFLYNIFNSEKEMNEKDKEYLCALRLSYNNFDELKNKESNILYNECKKSL